MKRAVNSTNYDGVKKLNDLFKDGYEVERIDGNGVYILNKIEMSSDKEDPTGEGILHRAMKLIGEAAQKMVEDDGFENGSIEVVKPSEKPKLGHVKSNHELEEMINSLHSQFNGSRTAILELNDRVTEIQLERLTQSHQDLTPHIRIEFDDINSVPKVWVDGKRVDENLTRINVDWNTNTEKIEHKSFDINWFESRDGNPIRGGVAQNNFTTVGLNKEKSYERN